MDPLSNLSQVIETLRRQLGTGTARATTRGTASSGSTGTARNAASAGRGSLADLRRAIRERIRGMDPRDERQRRAATRIFLESVLQWEFGDSLVNDPAFHELLAEVQKTMSDDPRVGKDVVSLLEHLAA
jgi:hypothetical protein